MCPVKLLDLLSLADRAGLIRDARLELLSLDHSLRETGEGGGLRGGRRVRWKQTERVGQRKQEREWRGDGEEVLAPEHQCAISDADLSPACRMSKDASLRLCSLDYIKTWVIVRMEKRVERERVEGRRKCVRETG